MSLTARAKCCTASTSQVAPNEIVAIMGRNGMGKTTLMKSLIGIVPPSGSVTMEGAELARLQEYERVARGWPTCRRAA